MKKFLVWAVSLLMVFSLAACSNDTASEKKEETTGFTITDQAGREVTFDEPADTAVSGYYIATSTIIGLGQEDKLKGVEMKADKREIYKKAAPEVIDLPAMGNKKSFNVEAAAETKADVAFLPISLKDYVSQLEDLGMKVILLNPETQEDYDEAVTLIAKVLGADSEAEKYFNYRNELFKKYISDVDEMKSVYMAGTELLEGAGTDMFQHDLLQAAKAENVLKDAGKGWSKINKEAILSMNPDVIFLEQEGITVEDVYNDATLAELDAVKNKQVYLFPSALETWDTPNLSSCLGTLWAYATLYPEKLSMDTVKEEAKTFYQTFYGIEVADTDLGL